MPSPKKSMIGILLSGGLDSAVLLDQLLGQGRRVVPFYVRTECIWADCELVAIEKFLATTARPALAELITFDMPLEDLYENHWSITGSGVPDDATPDEAVYLPGHNPMLLIKPMLWCATRGIGQLAMATLANNPFDDATPEFFAQFESMVRLATGATVTIQRPFERFTKAHVMELGRRLPLEITFSCLSPVDGLHCGSCNKCGERRRAFKDAGAIDRTRYALPAPANL
jgi:7-cyano-7-deazaguanine synthase